MITYHGHVVRIISADVHTQLATVERPGGRVAVIKVAWLEGSEGGTVEVLKAVTVAAQKAARLEVAGKRRMRGRFV